MSRYTVELTLDVADFYSVVNALRDACGCPECRRIADSLLEQRRAAWKCSSSPLCRWCASGLSS